MMLAAAIWHALLTVWLFSATALFLALFVAILRAEFRNRQPLKKTLGIRRPHASGPSSVSRSMPPTR
jgi:hypothetical protein